MCHLCLIYPKYFKVVLGWVLERLSVHSIVLQHVFTVVGKKEIRWSKVGNCHHWATSNRVKVGKSYFFISFFWSARASCTFDWSVCKNSFSPSFLSPPFPSSPPSVPSPLVTPGHPWSPRSPQSVTPVTPVSLTFCLLFCTFLVFSVLFPYFVVLFHHFFRNFSLFPPIFCNLKIIFKKPKVQKKLLARAIYR